MEAESCERPKTMEAESSRCSFATNWTVVRGSLENSISFESSTSPIDDSVGSSPSKPPPLRLDPPASDPCPCEIKINFAQKHEVRQVYVRSSARIYEIYYAPDPQSVNDYLCTVQCSVAAKDEELVHTVDIEELVHTVDIEVVSEQLKGLNRHLTDEKFKNDNNSSNNEDDWVEVKLPNSPPLDNITNSLPTKIDTNRGRSTQVFYEATAEITDANPSMSLTLRLLSLQNKGCVYVDEIYLFADPVDSIDLESPLCPMENSAGSSLMAMLVPTLLQLSKTGVGRIQEKQTSDTREKQKYQEVGSEATDATDVATKIQQEGRPSITVQKEASGFTAEAAQLQTPSQVSDTEKKPYFIAKENSLQYGHLERALDQLVSRVGRVEDLCLRFEESMLRPISSIEARLQRVEQQLEVLSKKSNYSELPSCSRFSAPEFTCNESDSNSFYNDGGDFPCCGAVESDKKDFPSEKLSIPTDDTSVLVSCRTDKLSTLLDDASVLANTTHLLPSLVVTAPEFSNAAEEENDGLEQVTDSLRAEPKSTLLIDDALASALAGFLTSTSMQPFKYTPVLTVNAPEFSSGDDDNDNDNGIASPGVQGEIVTDPAICSNETTRMEHVKCCSVSTPCDISSVETKRGFEDHDHEEMFEGVAKQANICDEGKVNSRETGADYEVAHAEHGARADNNQTTEETNATEKTNAGEASNGATNSLDSDEIYIPLRFLGDETEDSSYSTQEEADASTDLTASTKVTKEGSNKGILQDVLNISHSSSTVDFEIPILDVKFISQENSYAKLSLEALLTDRHESNVEAPCAEESNGGAAIGEQSKLILVENVEPTDPATVNNPLVYLDNYDVKSMPLSMEGNACCNQEMFSASLI